MIRKTLSRKIKRLARPLIGTLAVALVFALLASGSLRKATANNDQNDSPQAVFTNATAITINDADVATPYPSNITVSGLGTSIPATPGSVQVTLNGFSHTFPDDVGIVLVGPTGAALLIQDGAGDDPDEVNVTYTLSDTGATVLPDAAAWPAGTYKPTAYFTGDAFPAPGPGTTYGNPGPAGAGTATFSSVFGGTNPNGVWHLYVVDFVGGDDGAISGGWSLTINAPSATTPQHVVDFDGDGKTDPAVVRGSGGNDIWFIQQSTAGAKTQQWGLTTDVLTPADFDGDGKTDIAVWRPGAPFSAGFYILQSSNNTLRSDQFGQTGDDPTVVGDYDGDGKADPATYRAGATSGQQSYFYYRASTGAQSGQIIYNPWGTFGDKPVPGDYDGDHKYDFVVQRDSGGGAAIYYFKNSTSGQTSLLFGNTTDMIVPGDYDGDGKTDLAVARSSGGALQWFVRASGTGTATGTTFGLSTDITAQGDYDGDGKTDMAVYRSGAPGAFYWRRSSDGGNSSFSFGTTGDTVPAHFNTH